MRKICEYGSTVCEYSSFQKLVDKHILECTFGGYCDYQLPRDSRKIIVMGNNNVIKDTDKN